VWDNRQVCVSTLREFSSTDFCLNSARTTLKPVGMSIAYQLSETLDDYVKKNNSINVRLAAIDGM
jgi:hypothetical protein